MVALRWGTEEFTQIFGADVSDLEMFRSRLPSHQELQNAWCDPSIRTSLGLDRFEALAARQSQDLSKGARALLFDLASNLGNEAGKLVNFPMEKLAGLRATIQSSPIAGAISENDVIAIFNGQDADKAIKAAGKVALGVGLAAVGTAIPVVGQIGAAVVALGKAIYSILDAQKKALDQKEAAVREAMYQTFPPLQTADSVTDSGLVQNHLRAILTSQDWTPVFLPRFQGEWVGIERDKGFAFAPGKKTKWSDEFGGDKAEAFVPSGGVGLIPGTSILTSVIQVNLDPRGHAFSNFLKGGDDPRGPMTASNPMSGAQYVIDTGSFYPATARLGALAWEWATRTGSPYLYRLDVPRMHAAWKAYCDAGIDYLRERVFPWYAKFLKAKAHGDGDNVNLEGFFGAAVYYGVGSWACRQSGGTNFKPVFTKSPIPSGRYREQIKAANLYPNSAHSGGFLPILSEPSQTFQNCMGTIYYRNPAIRDVLNKLQERQRSDLRRTLVCAYVRRTDAAFVGEENKALLHLLNKQRALLLTSEDRFYVNMLDVPEDETHEGQDWRGLLLKSGVPALPNNVSEPKKRLTADEPGEPPELPPLRVGDPVPAAWKPKVATLVLGGLSTGQEDEAGGHGEAVAAGRDWRDLATGAAAFGGLFAAGWAISKRWSRKSAPE
ncbi:hypothetical protein [Nannocystis pusilla]|uniref:Transmembrane protein n=1 Tax=Nannocystis pusilla TaxID=889268 RepID=A0ABS7TJ26_9BACT|nr:hypothetical protein [Nannocystis pusilla]MBZ5708220.1 hypothetical protein [Nannocystis pusilla]